MGIMKAVEISTQPVRNAVLVFVLPERNDQFTLQKIEPRYSAPVDSSFNVRSLHGVGPVVESTLRKCGAIGDLE